MISRPHRFPLYVAIIVLVITTVACTLTPTGNSSGPRRIVMLTRLPTLTPTAIAKNAVPLVDAPGPVQLASAPNTSVDAPIQPVSVANSDVDAPVQLVSASNSDADQTGQPAATPEAVAVAVTPTPLPTNTDITPSPTPSPTNSLDTSPSPTPTNVPANAPTATPTIEPTAWSFANIKVDSDELDNGIIFYGEFVNNTDTTQELTNITGTFYNAQGQVTATEDQIFDYWPIEIIPAGESIPFELAVTDIDDIADFDLHIESQPSDQALHQNFQITSLEQYTANNLYCLSGQLQNQGAQLQDYLTIIAVLYDADDHVIGFGEYFGPDAGNVQNDQFVDFDLCASSNAYPVARHELRIWGQ